MAFMYDTYLDYLCPLNVSRHSPAQYTTISPEKCRKVENSNTSLEDDPETATSEKEETKPKPIPRPSQLIITIEPPESFTDRDQNVICERLTQVKIFIETEERRIGRYWRYNRRRGAEEGLTKSCGQAALTSTRA
jgi:hypothetical protein